MRLMAVERWGEQTAVGWMGRDDQRLRDIIQVMVIAGLANPKQDLICLISSWDETSGGGWGCQELSQRAVRFPGP